MLTGRPRFEGPDVERSARKCARAEPDWNALPPARRSGQDVLRALPDEGPGRPSHDIGDVRLALLGAFDRPRARARPGRDIATAWAGWLAALVVAVAAIALLVSTPRQVADPPETRLDIVTPPGFDPLSIDISPDGRAVIFQAGDEGRLWLGGWNPRRRSRSRYGLQREAVLVARQPMIAFFANGELKRIDLAEGFVRTLAPAPNPRHGTWNRDGTIVFGGVAMGPLHRVPAGGGTVTQVTDLLPGQTSHRWPQFLPDGRRFLLMALGTPDVRGLYVGSLRQSDGAKSIGLGGRVLVRATGSPPGGARRRPARPGDSQPISRASTERHGPWPRGCWSTAGQPASPRSVRPRPATSLSRLCRPDATRLARSDRPPGEHGWRSR